ncbi:unnamed protein product [Paramecium sonneborni]|uniref:Uncharacterized protein n=1 Tax=Paramecium sonneborni TaxID=65129 RepID=A0A8S1LRL4_9CILI|nr:unnamed protein product [Paramecium sonneborni]
MKSIFQKSFLKCLCRTYFNFIFNVNIKSAKFVYIMISVFRDESILKGLLQAKQIEQGAELHLFILVEQNVRKIIQEAIKYQRHFRKKQLTCMEVEQAIKDQNLHKFEIVGFQHMDSINLTKRMNEYVLNDQNLDLRDLITLQMRTVKIPLGQPSISLFNVMKDYKLLNSQETQQIMQYKDIIQVESFQNFEDNKSFNIIKDNIISILTIHQQQILKNFKDLFEKEVTSLKLCLSQEFCQLLSDLENYKDVAQIVPFIIQYLQSQQDQIQLQYYKHRSIIIYCISQIISNKQIDIEFQLHNIIKILIKFLTGKIEEINIKSQVELQRKIAKCLNYLLDKYNQKYQTLRSNINQIFHNRIDKIIGNLSQKKSFKQLLKIYSIIEFFTEQNVNVQHLKFVEQLSVLIQKLELKNSTVLECDQNYNQLVGLIQMSLGKILIKIVDGLQYIYPINKQELQKLITSTRELMNEQGLGQLLVLQYKYPDHIHL